MITKIATVCMNVSYDKEQNLGKYLSYMQEAANAGAGLIAFPEQSLMGYLDSLAAVSPGSVAYQYENAETIPYGECVSAIIAKADELNIYTVFGMTERDAERYDVLYNTAVLTGPDGYVGRYRKVHQPADEAHVYYPGDNFPVFDTGLGRIGLLICYDKAFPESARGLAIKGAELLIMPTAWPVADPSKPIESDRMTDLYLLYDRVRALENQAFFISSNHSGHSGEIDYVGYSEIISPSGEVLATTGAAEGIAYAEVDIAREVIAGRTTGFIGLNLLKDRRPIAYETLTSAEGYAEMVSPIDFDSFEM